MKLRINGGDQLRYKANMRRLLMRHTKCRNQRTQLELRLTACGKPGELQPGSRCNQRPAGVVVGVLCEIFYKSRRQILCPTFPDFGIVISVAGIQDGHIIDTRYRHRRFQIEAWQDYGCLLYTSDAADER